MKYTLEEYRDEFFNGNQSAMMRYWQRSRQQYKEWESVGSVFYVIGEEHVRAPAKNIITFEEGVK